MDSKNPLQDLLDQINSLLKNIDQKKGVPPKGMASEDIEKQLTQLEAMVADFEAHSEGVLDKLGLTERDVRREMRKNPKLNVPRSQAYGERTKSLKEKAQQLGDHFASVPLTGDDQKQQYIPEEEEETEKKPAKKDPFAPPVRPTKKEQQNRKGKFKRLGGKNDWRPL